MLELGLSLVSSVVSARFPIGVTRPSLLPNRYVSGELEPGLITPPHLHIGHDQGLASQHPGQ